DRGASAAPGRVSPCLPSSATRCRPATGQNDRSSRLLRSQAGIGHSANGRAWKVQLCVRASLAWGGTMMKNASLAAAFALSATVALAEEAKKSKEAKPTIDAAQTVTFTSTVKAVDQKTRVVTLVGRG